MGNSLKRVKLGNSLANGLLVNKGIKLGNSLLASGVVAWVIHLF